MKKIFILILLILNIAIIYYLNYQQIGNKSKIVTDTNLSIRELAEKNNIKPGELKRLLAYKFDIKQKLYGSTVINELNISIEQLLSALNDIIVPNIEIKHIIKVVIWSILLFFVLNYFFTIKNKKHINKIRVVIMFFTFVVFGIVLGYTLNPMESIVKFIKLIIGLENNYKYIVGVLSIFSIYSIIGPKLICSYGCPIGALQELVFNISFLKKKKFKIPSIISLLFRIIIMLIFILGLLNLFGINDFLEGRSFYSNINFFKIFNISDISEVSKYLIPILLILSFFTFRPFCHLICPFSLYSWILSKFTLKKIVLNKDVCIKCNSCKKVCPTNAMTNIFDKKFIIADCWSCGKCIAACKQNAIKYE